MSVYKVTCETGKIYYGSTGSTLKRRKAQGWYKCACKDFINPTIEELHAIKDKKERLLKENYYVVKFECVNFNRVIALPNKQEYLKNWNEKNKEKQIIKSKENRKKVVEEKRHYCALCELAFQAPKKLIRHEEGSRHKLKKESYDKYGEEWKKHYLNDNKERYKQNKKLILKN